MDLKLLEQRHYQIAKQQ